MMNTVVAPVDVLLKHYTIQISTERQTMSKILSQTISLGASSSHIQSDQTLNEMRNTETLS